MALEGIGKVIGRKTRTNEKDYVKTWIYVPTKVAEDSSFPFEHGDEVIIKIDIETENIKILKKR